MDYRAKLIREQEEIDFIADEPFDDASEFEHDDEEEVVIHDDVDDLESSIRAQLRVPEYSRRPISFRKKGEEEIIEAVPMAKMKEPGAYLMKRDNIFKKYKIQDIEEV